MDRLIKALLSAYDPQDKELYLKAKFILIITLFVISILTLIMMYTAFLGSLNSRIVAIELAGFGVMLCALRLLVKGFFSIAVHTILVSGFATIWIILFVEPGSTVITKLDSIVFVPALLAAMPLLLFKERKPMVFYYLVNMTLFSGYAYYLHESIPGIRTMEVLDYFFDNAVSITFVFLVSFNLFAIYQEAMSSLKVELLERKKAERSVKRFRVLLENIINSMPSMIVVIDLRTRVSLWNQEAERLTGIAMSEAKQQDIFAVLPQLSAFREKIERVIQENTVQKTAKAGMTWGDRDFIMDVTIYPLVFETVDGAVIRMDDVSERVRMEAMVVQSEKMLSIGGLAAGMAHEINNPLAGMLQNTQVIQNRLTRARPPNEAVARELGISTAVLKAYMEKRGVLSLLGNIHSAGVQASKIVKNMLGFARKSDAVKHPFILSEIIDKTIALAESDYDLKKKYDFRQIQIQRSYAPDMPPVPCEESKIQQVLFNILKNASEALSDCGQEGPRIDIRLYRQGVMACIDITDNGPGMDTQISKRIFEPFFTTKKAGMGTGLGLSVSYFLIVEDHHGQMEVTSGIGKGTTFTVRLPFEPVDPSPVPRN